MNASEFVIFGAIDVGAVIEIIVIILVIFGSVIGKLLSVLREQKPPAEQQRPAGQQKPPVAQLARPKPRQNPQPAAQGRSVKDEIDEFLRRASEKRQAPSANPPRRMPQPTPQSVQKSEVMQAEVIRERPVGGEVGEHAKKFLDEKEFAQRASKLGSKVATTDEKIELHMKEVFGRGIGKLAAMSGETALPPTPPPTGFFQDEVPVLATAGTGLASLLNNIDNLRQAIVLNEILQRPMDRWK